MSMKIKLAIVALFVLIAIVYTLRLDNVVGLWVDDGGYAVLGKAIATGQGYKLIGESNPLDTSFYQPGMPLALAVMWKLFPTFPGNIPWLKLVNLLSVASFGTLVFIHFRKRAGEGIALGIAAGTALCPSFVFLATSSLMSECLFAAIQFAAMMAAERVVAESRDRPLFAAMAGLLAGYSYLTRTVGVCVVLIALLWIARKRMWREAAIFAVSAGLLIGGWLFLRNERQQMFTEAQKKEMNYSGFVFERQATTGVSATPRDFSDRILQNTMVLAGADMGAMFAPSLYRSVSESGEEQVDTTTVLFHMRDSLGMGTGTMGNNASTIILSFVFSALVLIGFTRALRTDDRFSEWLIILSFVAIVTYSWTPLRFLVPLLPFLFFYLYRGIMHIAAKWKFRDALVRMAFAVVIAMFAVDHAGYVASKHRDWDARYLSAQHCSEWVKNNVPASEVIASGNAPLAYLLTDRTVERCRIEDCRAHGRRIYLLIRAGVDTQAGDKFLFKSGYAGQGVIQLGQTPR
jgi:hypothetical protein